MKYMGLILAAGKSKRFGNANKLLAPLNKNNQNKPLVSFAIDAMKQVQIDCRVALVGDPILDSLFDSFKILRPLTANAGLGQNLAVGAAYAKKMHATHLLISLGDMPLITAEILGDIKKSCSNEGISIAQGTGHISVPACFHSSFFNQLIALDGDKGAGMIARSNKNTNYIRLNERQLCDVDTIEDLEKLESFYK